MQAYIIFLTENEIPPRSTFQILLSTLSHSNQSTGQECCYNKQGNLIVGPLNGGSLDRVHTDEGLPVFSHFFHDLVPYWDCCMWSDNCDKYFEKRPSDDGAKYIPVRPGKNVFFMTDIKMTTITTTTVVMMIMMLMLMMMMMVRVLMKVFLSDFPVHINVELRIFAR